MKKAKFKCKRCGNRFEASIFEPGEAEVTKRLSSPICCPECSGPVERV